MRFEEIRDRVLGALEVHSEGSVYLKASAVPTSYPAGIYEYTGFKGESLSNNSGSRGYHSFNLYILEDVTDYGKTGDIWEKDSDVQYHEDILRNKLENLAKALYSKGMKAESFEVYPGVGNGQEFLFGKLEVRAKGRI